MNEPILIEPAGLVIDPETYRTHERHRELADRVMAEFGYEPRDVTEIRLTEVLIEVDWIDRSREREFVIRTTAHPASCSARA